MKILKIIGWVSLIALVIIQFIRPEKNSTDDTDYVAAFETETNPSTEVRQILKTTCYDCHSDNTVYPMVQQYRPNFLLVG